MYPDPSQMVAGAVTHTGPMPQASAPEDPFQGTVASIERAAKAATVLASERDQLRNQVYELRERVAQLEQQLHAMVGFDR